MASTELDAASPWEQRLYDLVVGHVEDEAEILAAYEDLLATTDSPAFAFLARLVLDDEQRHHQLLRALAETIRISVAMTDETPPIPDLAFHRADRSRILVATERFLEVERRDNVELDEFADELRTVANQTMWQLIVRLIQHDNQKHRRILEFVRDRARDSG